MQAQSGPRLVDHRPAATAALAASLVFAAGIAFGAVAGFAARPGAAPLVKSTGADVSAYIQHRDAEMGAPAAPVSVLGTSWYSQHRDAEISGTAASISQQAIEHRRPWFRRIPTTKSAKNAGNGGLANPAPRTGEPIGTPVKVSGLRPR